MGTSHRLPKPVSRKQLINRVTNNVIAQEMLRAVSTLGSPQVTNRNIGGGRVSQLDVHDLLTRTSPAVQFSQPVTKMTRTR
jgi:hypothetical protein